MKILKYSFVVFILLSCNKENAPDCFQTAGDIITREIVLDAFTSITVYENIELIVKQGNTHAVKVETGENLIDEIEVKVEADRLVLRNSNGCNFLREYGLTKVYVTAPNLAEIRSSTGWPIRSDGVLNYDNLTLLSESFIDAEAETTDGEFNLSLNSNELKIVVNGIAYFNLKGEVDAMNITIAAGDSRIEAESLIVNSININHRGTNDVHIRPQASLIGVIRGTGDVISYSRPSIIEVEELYIGRLIFD